jgi:citrate lyase beta subunit
MTGIDMLASRLDDHLAATDADLADRYPGDDGSRQPAHTVYVPADRFHAGLVPAWGRLALQALDADLGDVATVAEVVGIEQSLAAQVLPLVRAKLVAEPVEDLRIDFEDGYGTRDDATEDEAVDEAVIALLAAQRTGTAPPFTGIRFKSFEAPTRRRGLATLAPFVSGLADRGGLPEGFVVILPKVTAVEQVGAMVLACEHLEGETGLRPGSLRFEIQVETPQSILLADGSAAVARMIAAAGRRCTALHYGTYDYSASLGIAAEYQSMEHPAADHAKAVMQVAAAGTGVRLSDGSTNVIPVGTTRARYAAWRLHARLVRRSLERGFYQGWDLHPAQLPTRYAATFAFYRSAFPTAAQRLRAYVRKDDSGHLDEPATARGTCLVRRARPAVRRHRRGRDPGARWPGPGRRRAPGASRSPGVAPESLRRRVRGSCRAEHRRAHRALCEPRLRHDRTSRCDMIGPAS